MQQRSSNKQLALNISTNAMSYILGLIVTFFLTPYIVRKLGASAYGFIGLSNNIISYTSLLTIALNSMSNRYIAIHYHKRDYFNANGYLASTFYANVFISVIIVVGMAVLTLFLDKVLDIPSGLVLDVKILFTLLFVNAAVGLITNVFSISTFVKNRIEKSNIRNMIGTLIRCGLLILLFALFKPELWYFGITAIIMTIYVASTNFHFYRTLTPELIIEYSKFNLGKVWELVKSGAWNLISSLSNLLNEGLELLLANIFISPQIMGLLAISKTIPTLISSFVISLVSSFNPEYTKLYAEGRMEELKQTILKSIRLLSFISATPLSMIFAYGDAFYRNWLPTENTDLLYYLSCVAAFLLVFALPYQSVWYVFVLDNKLKRSSINALVNSIITFIVVMIGMIVFKDDMMRLFILVCSRSLISSIRCVTFLPLYGASVMKFPKFTFYRPMMMNCILVILISSVSLFIKGILIHPNWISFFCCVLVSACIGLILSWFICLKKTDRNYLTLIVSSRIKRRNG